MSRIRDEQIRQWAEEFRTYSDVIATPGWRLLVEEPLAREIEWCKTEIAESVLNQAVGVNVQDLVELKAYVRALQFVLQQVLHREDLGETANKVLRRRAEELGRTRPDDRGVPKFAEVK